MIGNDQIIAVAIACAGAAVALCLVIVGARGQVRLLATIGTVLILLGVITRFAFHWISERYFNVLRTEDVVSILSVDVVAGGVLTGLGLLLLTRALIIAS